MIGMIGVIIIFKFFSKLVTDKRGVQRWGSLAQTSAHEKRGSLLGFVRGFESNAEGGAQCIGNLVLGSWRLCAKM
jgi:hypothetical protein